MQPRGNRGYHLGFQGILQRKTQTFRAAAMIASIKNHPCCRCARWGVFYTLSVLASWASAETVYKYVAEDGTVTYSDTPPSHTAAVDAIEMRDYPEVDAASRVDRFERQAQTADRLQKARLEREKIRREEQEKKSSVPETHYYPAPNSAGDSSFPPDYPYYWPYPSPEPHWRAPHPQPQKDPRQERLDDWRTPLRIPPFGGRRSRREVGGDN